MKTSYQQANRIQMMLGMVLLIVLIGIAAVLAWAVWRALAALAPEVTAAIVAGAVTVLVSVASLIISKQWERRSVIEQEHRKQKAPAYTKFIAFLFKTFRTASTTPMPHAEMQASLDSFNQELIIWGSDDVLRRYTLFQREARKLAEMNQQPSKAGEQPPEVTRQVKASILAFENVLYAIRADLGHATKGMKPGELLSVFLTDTNKVIDLD